MHRRSPLRAEMAALLLVLLAANVVLAAAVVVVLMALSTVIPKMLADEYAGYAGGVPEVADVVSVLFDGLGSPLLPAVVVLFAIQVVYALRWVEPGERLESQTSEAPDLTDRLRRLAVQADASAPEVRVVESEMANSFTPGRGSSATVYVTSALRERLDPEGIDAVLAHELAHVKNRDATVITLASSALYLARALFYAMVFYFFVGGIAILLTIPVGPLVELILGPVGLWDRALTDRTLILWIALSMSGLFVAVAVSPFLLLDRLAKRFSMTREYAADAAAAELLGGSAPLAGALERLSADGGRPRHDLRKTWSRIKPLCVVAVPDDDYRTDDGDGGEESENDDSEVEPIGRLWWWLLLLGLPILLPLAFLAAVVVAVVAALVFPALLAIEMAAGATLEGAHPPVEERIDRLGELAGDRYGER